MRGAILITAGAFISRLLGAIYRPVAQVFIGDKGLALATPPSNVYQVILAISAVGLNVAISRLVSQRLALEDYRGARHVFRVTTAVLLISGAVFSLLFAVSAKWLAAFHGYPDAWLGFLVLSPAILLVTLECSFRGLYQGMQQMRPSAVSQVVEQIGRVGVGLILVVLFSGAGVNYGAAGFNAGNTVGVLLGALYGGWIYFRDRPTASWAASEQRADSLEHESTRALLSRIMAIALPLSLIGAVLPLMNMVDALVVKNRLLSIGAPAEYAEVALAYLGNAGTLRDLPSILTMALYVSLVPAVTEAMAKQRLDQARYRAATAMRITLLVGIPATVGLLVGARDAYGVAFAGEGYTVMAPLAWSTIFLMLQQTASGTLQGMGLIWVSVRNLLLGVALKTVLTYWWTGIPAWQASGAAYATDVGFFTAAALNLWSLRRNLGLGIHLKNDAGRPLLAAAIMGVAIWLVSPLSHAILPGHRLPGLLTVTVGGLIYVAAILAVGGITEADLGLIPGVRPGWIRALRRYRLLRE